MSNKEFATMLVILWRDWEAIFGKDFEGIPFEDKWDSFIRHIDLNYHASSVEGSNK